MAQKAQQHPTTSNETSHLVIIFLSDFVVQFSLQLFLTDLGGNQLKEFCSLAKPHWPQCVFLKVASDAKIWCGVGHFLLIGGLMFEIVVAKNYGIRFGIGMLLPY